MLNDFCVFILSHGRPDNVKTYSSLRKGGYTGRVVIVIDNEDETAEQYQENFGVDNVYTFDKKAIAMTTDSADNTGNRKVIVYARNACFGIARELGFRYFLQVDDDYSAWVYKFNDNNNYSESSVKRLDEVFLLVLGFYKSTKAATICFAQNGDFIGGAEGSPNAKIMLLRKAMNTFFCCVDRPIKWLGRINEDVSTYVLEGSRGVLFLTLTQVSIIQQQTQASRGGMTETYGEGGTYLKSFYSVLHSPSCVTVRMMGESHRRLHHRVKWKNAVPLILSEKHKKQAS